jgi:type II secretory pathway component PulK
MSCVGVDAQRIPVRDRRRSSGIVLAIVLVLIFVLVIAVTAFQRRAIIDTSIATNRLRAAEADALARGGLRIAAAMVYVIHLKEQAGAAGADIGDVPGRTSVGAGAIIPPDELWSRMGDYELDVGGGRTLRVSIEDEGSRLNLNALVEPVADTGDAGGQGDDSQSSSTTTSADDEDAELYLESVLEYIISGIEEPPEDTLYDAGAIARNILDYIDGDSEPRSGNDEDRYYHAQDPPYSSRNGPFLSIDEIGLVEGIDATLLEAMRSYVTVYPIGSVQGINLNHAQPWVLSIVSIGASADRRFIKQQTVRDIWALREESKILCDDLGYDPARCVSPNEVGNGELTANGSIYPESLLPAEVSVFRVVAEATVGRLTRRIEAIYDTRPLSGPQLLSWRRLRGSG